MIYIYTICYNTPKFVKYQYLLLKKFIENDFKYIVYNNTCTNTKDGKIYISEDDKYNDNELNLICKEYNIENIKIPSELYGVPFENSLYYSNNDPSTRAGISIDYATKDLLNKYDKNNIFLLLDNDLFLLNNFNIVEFMKNISLSSRLQYRKEEKLVKYINNHIVIFNTNKIDNNLFDRYFSFKPDIIEENVCDCGANTYYIIKDLNDYSYINWYNKLLSNIGYESSLYGLDTFSYDDFNINFYNSLNINLKNYLDNEKNILGVSYNLSEIIKSDNNDTIFLHLKAGTNWNNIDLLKKNNRENNLFNFLNILIK